jgi:hypothetical protein
LAARALQLQGDIQVVFFRSVKDNGALLVAASLVSAMLATASHAYTQEQAQLCSGDAMRLCGSEIPDVDRITACMAKKRAQLSEGCRAVFRADAPDHAASVSYANKPAKSGWRNWGWGE